MAADCGPTSAKRARTEGPMLRVCFVGCGGISKCHLVAALSTGRVSVTCLVDPDKEKRKELREKLTEALVSKGEAAGTVSEFDSLEAALEADPDQEMFSACDIMVPSFVVAGEDLHEKVTSVALHAKRHVFLEKPVTVSPEAAARLISLHAEVASEKVFAAAENARFWPEVLAAKECIEQGGIGEILTARAKFWESAGGPWADDYLPGTWRCDESKLPAASFTYDGASHWIRPLRMWMGEISRVVGLCGRTLDHMPGASSSQHVLAFRSGKTAIFESMLAPKAISDQPFFTVQGTLGEIVLDGFDGGARLYTLNEKKETVSNEICNVGWDAGYAGEYVDFVEACLDGQPTKGPVSEALEDLKVVVALFKSAKTECWETV